MSEHDGNFETGSEVSEVSSVETGGEASETTREAAVKEANESGGFDDDPNVTDLSDPEGEEDPGPDPEEDGDAGFTEEIGAEDAETGFDDEDFTDETEADDETDWDRTSLTKEQEATLREMEADEDEDFEVLEENPDWTPPKESAKHLPLKRTGSFSGERGNSEFTPNSQEARQKMAEYGRTTVEYKNGDPDFSPFAVQKTEKGELDTTVEIGHMTGNRENGPWEFGRRPNGTSHDIHYDIGNFPQADNELLEKYRKLYPDATLDDITQFKEDNKLVWHECADGKTMQLVPEEIHDACRHSGGVSMAKLLQQYGDVTAPFDD